MKKVDYKGRCIKRQLSKCKDVCRSYSEMQDDYARFLQVNEEVKQFTCNVKMNDDPETASYTTDFVITLVDGTVRVRECVYRKHLERPSTAKLLDLSKNYWLSKGVVDWGIVVDVIKVPVCLYDSGNTIYRVLVVHDDVVLAIDCIKRTMPLWLSKERLTDWHQIDEKL